MVCLRNSSISALLLLACMAMPGSVAGQDIDFVHDVQPILRERCVACHGPLKQESGLRLDAGFLAIKGGDGGPVIVPGKSVESRFFQAISGGTEVEIMPAEGKPLEPAQIAVLGQWIDAGAPIPDHEDLPADPRNHWFFRVPVKAPVPSIAGVDLSNPVDCFLQATRGEKQLAASPAAEESLLLRRVYFDLIGLPPSREELHRFVNDTSPDKYQQMVDQLLADPRYGQRWARHWMDVWRYSDYIGNATEVFNGERHVWRWRDWIVDSLNADKGYDRMVQEMLAGDELAPGDTSVLPATGYLLRSQANVGGRNVWLQDVVEHTAQAMLGLTFRCARCHDHKYDPISQAEYYSLRAVFESIGSKIDRLPQERLPEKDGLARIFDQQPIAETKLFIVGNPQQPDDKLKIVPATPHVLGVAMDAAHSVNLPPEVANPALIGFVREQEVTATESQLRLAEEELVKFREQPVSTTPQQLTLAEKRKVAADLAVTAVKVNFQAAHAEFQAIPEAAAIAKTAGHFQRQAAALRGEIAELEATTELEKLLADTPEKQNAGAVEAARMKLTAAKEVLTKAREQLQQAADGYDPIVKKYPAQSSGRRTAFARWLTRSDNPATARVAVNHIWLRHFGQPLVETVFDFGLNGRRPTHPELLDWLAVDMMEHGWSLKHLHRQLVTSQAYRMQSTRRPGHKNEQIDPDNVFLWRMNPRRLDAEVLRDTVLSASGKLETSHGGAPHDPSEADRVFRRSLYFRHSVEESPLMLKVFDGPDANECYRRSVSIVPQQALALSNSRFSLEQSRLIAGRLSSELAGSLPDAAAFTTAAFELLLSRAPSTAESAECAGFLAQQAELYRVSTEPPIGMGQPALVAAAQDSDQRARESLIHVLLNSDGFLTIREKIQGRIAGKGISMADRRNRQHASNWNRREFLARTGMGLGGLALADLLNRERPAHASDQAVTRQGPHFAPRAKSVIWLFMTGGVSQLESFDPKPALNTFAGKTIAETPHADVLKSPLVVQNVQSGQRQLMQQIYPLQVGFKKYGQSGIEISDWWPHVGKCVDDLAIVRSMWTTDTNHQAQYQFHSGRNFVEGSYPSIGAWVHYGLGSLNENIPQFILFGPPLGNCCGGNLGHGADYLGPEHAAVRIDTSGTTPLPFVAPELPMLRQEQINEFDLIRRLSQQSAQAYPDDPETEARIKSYELAFRMQTSVPRVMDLRDETAETLQLYGLDRLKDKKADFAKQCLLARRYVESGVRFIQVMHGGSGAGDWDAHSELKKKYNDLTDEVDQPIAALLTDLKRRGLLDETLVVFATEFGRTPGLEVMLTPGAREGRDHHPYGFSVWMAGGGIKGGIAHGATDELGFHAVENRHYVTDIHATIMHQLGLTPQLLDVPGRKRLERDYGHPIHEIIA